MVMNIRKSIYKGDHPSHPQTATRLSIGSTLSGVVGKLNVKTEVMNFSV